MKIQSLHAWDLPIAEAKAIQQQFSQQVITVDRFDRSGAIEYVAGVDVGFPNGGKTARAAVTVLSFPSLNLVEQAVAEEPTVFPYVPGYLSFREVPPILTALAKLTIQPQLILCDGQGLAHPRRLGIACHLGLIVDTPTIGVAKSRLIGQHEPLGTERGDWQPLWDRGETIGAVLRTKKNVQPLYISIGHRISLPTAIDYVLQCTPKYRLPETTRQADRLSKTPPGQKPG
jgi:deoxyribonuclease V